MFAKVSKAVNYAAKTVAVVSFIIVVPVGATHAAPVTAKQVREMVAGWQQLSRRPLDTPLSEKITYIEAVSDTNSVVMYYVVHLKPQGFIIASADDRIEPLVAFSAQGQYKRESGSPLTILIESDMKSRLQDVGSRSQTQSAGVFSKQAEPITAEQSKWNMLIGAAGKQPTVFKGLAAVDDMRVAPLLKTHWNQRNTGWPEVACYNFYSPPYKAGNPKNYYCGCTQTVWAQIMRYFKWPRASIGKITNTIRVDGVEQQRTTFGAAYDWDNMPVDPDENTPEQQRRAIGGLTYDIGVVNGASYTDHGTSAGMSVYALQYTFGYSNS